MKIKIKDLVNLHKANDKSLVVDVGAYKGEYAEAMIEKFGCYVIMFEPLTNCYEILKEKFKNNPKVEIYNKAIGRYGKQKFYMNGVSSSLYVQSENSIELQVENLFSFINGFPDILKLNCEGAEYDILEDLIERKLLNEIPELLIQFHKINEIDFSRRRLKIYEELKKSHELIYDYKWDLWRKK